MASSDDFKAQLKTGNITEALALALSKAVELKITTWVTSDQDVETAQPKPGHRLCTHINTIEGEIENEIGDQFIANGRYRELQQFHLEQVAQSNQIIQSNLKSLQKLFEVIIAMRHQGVTTPVLEPNANQFESQLLPPVQELRDATFVTAPPGSAIEESGINQNLLTDNVVPAALSVAGATAAFLAIPEDSLEELDEEEDDDDDWDDSVLDLLESLPVESPDQANNFNSDMDEDWRNFIEEDESPEPEELDLPVNLGSRGLAPENLNSLPTFSELNVEQLNSQKDEDLGDLITENLSPKLVVGQDEEKLNWSDSDSSPVLPEPSIEQPNSAENEDWGDLITEEEPENESDLVTADLSDNQAWNNLNLDDFRSPPVSVESNLELTNSAEDEDWGDLIVEEESPKPDNLIPSMESLDLEEEDEWDDWVVEESEPLQETPAITIDALDVSGDNDWADFEENSDPFAVAPTPEASASSSEGNEDWDDFAPDELEPYTPVMDVDANVGADFDLSDALGNLNAEESVIQETDHPDLLDENLNTDSGLSQELNGFAPQSETIHLPQATDSDLMKMLLEETEPQQSQPHFATDDHHGVERQEDLFADMQFEELTTDAGAAFTGSFTLTPTDSEQEVITQDSESLVVSEDDLGHHATSDEQRVPPPPPPPSRLPNQNH